MLHYSNLCNYVFNDIASTIQVRPILAVQLALKFEAVFRRRPRHILQCLPRLRRQQPVLHRARGDVPRGRGCCVMYINHTTLSVAYSICKEKREREREREDRDRCGEERMVVPDMYVCGVRTGSRPPQTAQARPQRQPIPYNTPKRSRLLSLACLLGVMRILHLCLKSQQPTCQRILT